MSSRTAVCGQPPVSTAAIRSGGERLVAHEELGVLLREDVVGHDREVVLVAKQPAEREEQRRLAAPDRTADADGERPLAVVAAERRIAFVERARPLELVCGRIARCVRVMMQDRTDQTRRHAISVTTGTGASTGDRARLQHVENRRGLREILRRSSRRTRAACAPRSDALVLQPLRAVAARRSPAAPRPPGCRGT